MSNRGKLYKTETFQGEPHEVWRESVGSNSTFRWIDDYGNTKMTISIGHRPIEIQYTADERAYINHSGMRFYLDEFLPMSAPQKIDRWTFTHSQHDTNTSGYYIGIPEDVSKAGDQVYIARVY